MSRYGAAIEYDLACRGIDLGTEWRARRWRKLLNIIDHLPRNSSYVEAMAMDEELALEVLRRPEKKTPPRRRMSEWSAEVELLSTAVDRLSELIQAIAAGHGAKPTRLNPQPRPETAHERVKHRERVRKHNSIVARVLPHKANQASGRRPEDRSISGGPARPVAAQQQHHGR